MKIKAFLILASVLLASVSTLLAVLDKQAAKMEPKIDPALTSLVLKGIEADKRIDRAGLNMGAEQAAIFLDRSYSDNSDSALSPFRISRKTGSPLGNVLVALRRRV